jgi:hypothetical protein
MKNATTYLFRLSDMLFAKYAQADAGAPAGSPQPPGQPVQTYYVSGFDDDKQLGQVQGPVRDWDAAANLAAQKFFQAPKAQRIAGSDAGAFYIPGTNQKFYLE